MRSLGFRVRGLGFRADRAYRVYRADRVYRVKGLGEDLMSFLFLKFLQSLKASTQLTHCIGSWFRKLLRRMSWTPTKDLTIAVH